MATKYTFMAFITQQIGIHMAEAVAPTAIGIAIPRIVMAPVIPEAASMA